MEKQKLFESRVKRAEELFVSVAAPSLLESRIQGANAKFDAYNFGSGVRVVDERGWCYMNPTELILGVDFSVRVNGHRETHRGAFHVGFNLDGDVPVRVYAIDLTSGDEFGQDPGACEHNPGP